MSFVMKRLLSFLPAPDVAVGLPTAELAGYVLEVLMLVPHDERGLWNRRNFCMEAMRLYAPPMHAGDERVGVACSSAWSWLEANGFIARAPEKDNEWYLPTRRGNEVGNSQNLKAYLLNDQLPEVFLHDTFLGHVRPLFFQSRFDTAVFEAFKALEVAIRDAGGYGNEMFGKKLASAAFHPENGPLTDMSAEGGERQALMELMVGAIGSYKNPISHRNVVLEASETRDMIILASHLLKIVDRRKSLTPNKIS